MSWGAEAWGSGPWGDAVPLSIVSAHALSTHCVEVVLTHEPLHRSVLGAGDALNPRTWSVLHGTSELTPLSVELDGRTLCRVYLLHPLSDWTEMHTVTAAALRDVDDLRIVPPRSADFRGVLAVRPTTPLSGRYDLANPPTLTTDGAAGTLVASSSGGYQQVRGAEYFKKLILRRLTTIPGSFFHIPREEYGLGLRIKELLRTSDLIALKVAIEQECYREAGVSFANAVVSLVRTGALKIELKIKADTGDVSTSMEIERG